MIGCILLSFYHLIFGFSKSKILLILSFIILFILLGFKDLTVGTDSMVYANMFEEFKTGIFINSVEPAWMLFNKIVSFCGGDFYTIIWISAIFILFPIYLGISKYSPYPLFSIFIYITFYYYFYGFNITRQCIAQSFIFLSFCYLSFERNIFKQNKIVYLYFVLAVLFHYTALIYIFILGIIYYVKNKNTKMIFILALSFIIGIGFNSIILNIATIFLKDYSNETVSTNFISGLINLAILNIAFLIVNSFIKKKDKWFYGFYSFILLSNIMNGISYGNRLIIYSGILLTIFLPTLFFNLKLDKKWNGLIFFLIVSYCFFRFIRLFGSGEIFPYKNTLLNFIIIE